MTTPVRLFLATKAFIEHEGKVLVIRESSRYVVGTQTGRYDVIGGRLEPGEHFDDSLQREVKEETGLDIAIEKLFFVNESWPVVKGEQWQIVRIFLSCTVLSTDVVLSEDHDDFKWIAPEEYLTHTLVENLYPAFEAFLSLTGEQKDN